MKRFSQTLTARWFTIMVPVYTPPTTLMQRETLRKRQLLSMLLLAALILSVIYILYMRISAFPLDMTVPVIGTGSLVLALLLNRQGYLKLASLTFFFVNEASMFLGAQVSSASNPRIILWTCFLLTIFLVVMGLFIPPWFTILLAIFENVALFWYLLVLDHTYIVHLLHPIEFQQFLIIENT